MSDDCDALVVFLRARYAEEEQQALAGLDDTPLLTVHRSDGSTGLVRQGARWWEHRLADVHAKRDLLDAWESRAGDPEQVFDRGYAEGLETAIRILALPYVSHDEYRDDWQP